jgi:hypothetical protein
MDGYRAVSLDRRLDGRVDGLDGWTLKREKKKMVDDGWTMRCGAVVVYRMTAGRVRVTKKT